MTERHRIEAPGFPPDFHRTLGIFHCMFLMFDAMLDFSIGEFLKTEPIETHIMMSGMEFGKKLRLLIDLAKRSKHPKKELLVQHLRTLQSAKREIITHSYVASDETSVIFYSKSRGGDFKVTKTEFTMDEFADHVTRIVQAAQAYQNAFGSKMGDLLAFAIAPILPEDLQGFSKEVVYGVPPRD